MFLTYAFHQNNYPELHGERRAASKEYTRHCPVIQVYCKVHAIFFHNRWKVPFVFASDEIILLDVLASSYQTHFSFINPLYNDDFIDARRSHDASSDESLHYTNSPESPSK